MNAAALLFAVLAAPTLDIAVAPDQPIPYVYADEPVILHIKSTEDAKATGSVTIGDDSGKSVAIELQPFALRSNGAYWQPLEGAPALLGRYTAHIALDAGGVKIEKDLVYCRIERPGDATRTPFRATVNTPDRTTLNALRGIPIREITVPAATPDLAGVVSKAAAEGFDVAIALDAASIGDLPSLTQLAKQLGDAVGAWRIGLPEAGVEALDPIAAALHDAGSRGQLEVVLNSGLSNIDAYLAGGLARSAAKVFLPSGDRPQSDLMALRAAFENGGYEAFRLQTVFAAPKPDRTAPLPWSIVWDLLSAQCAGGTSPEIDVNALISDGSFEGPYTLLSAVAHRLNGYDYVDELPVAPRTRALVFRKGGDWLVALWSTGQPSGLPLPVGDATGLALTDANNNALPLPNVEGGAVKLPLTVAPVYVSGSGGPLLAAAARATARREAEAMSKSKSIQKNLPPEFVELLKPIAAPTFTRLDRVSFFALLRMFPVLEQKWHEGTIPREAAAPAMASLSRLARGLCVVEQDSGEPFIEILQDTIARCGDYQSRYLTSTSGSADKHERADWLLAEVARLTAEAKELADGGRGIEAVGVASLAEWRARSLEFARNAAPLGAPEPTHVQSAPPAPAPKPAPEPDAKPAMPAPKASPTPTTKKG